MEQGIHPENDMAKQKPQQPGQSPDQAQEDLGVPPRPQKQQQKALGERNDEEEEEED